MIFENYFISVAESLDAKYRGIIRKNQHKADKGEVCEVFLKDFLTGFFADSFRIFRGGQIININEKESRQIDVILTGKNSIEIFKDKGLYPIETVYGVFSVTSKLVVTIKF